ncbi:hypothetical protein [Nocardioides pakistanensis]
MKIRNKHLSVAAVATMFAIAGPGMAIATESGSPGKSAAEINLSDCMLESSKDISYVEYLADGSTITKDESVDAETLDLSTVEGIEDVDAVNVKAGTTVESFAVSCDQDQVEAPVEEAPDEDKPEDEAPEEEAPEEGEATYPWTGKASEKSTATITLAGCLLESSKDISYVAFLDDGSMVTKDESVDAETFDLSTVQGIEEFDAVQVKAGTTVESFGISCSQGEAAPVEEPKTEDSKSEDAGTEDAGTEDAGTEDSTGEHEYKSEDESKYESDDETADDVERERGHDEAKHQEKHQARVSENHDEAKHQEKHRGGVQPAEEDSDEADEHESEEKDDHEADDDHEVEDSEEHDD